MELCNNNHVPIVYEELELDFSFPVVRKCPLCEKMAEAASLQLGKGEAILRLYREPAGPEKMAKFFHQTYERLAPSFGYQTRKESSVSWEQVPENNRKLMTAVCSQLIRQLVAGYE